MPRKHCEIVGCGRTTGRGAHNWICADHWKLVRRETRRRFSKLVRELERAPEDSTEYQRRLRAAWAAWNRCVSEATEAAAGLR